MPQILVPIGLLKSRPDDCLSDTTHLSDQESDGKRQLTFLGMC